MNKTKKRPFLQVHLVEHCNLNCKGCAHFSPIAKPHVISLEKLEKTYRLLMPYLGEWFCRLELMGGEPLLHDQLEEILFLTRRYYPDLEVRLVTNGLNLLGMQHSFYETCVTNNIIICVSAYPINLDYDKMKRMFAVFGIQYKIYGEYKDTRSFISYKLNCRGMSDPVESFSNCKYSGHCVQVKNDKIYPCFISAYAQHLNDYFGLDFQWSSEDYLSLRDDLGKEDLERLIYNPVPFFRYCNMKKQETFEWEISCKSIDEWISS